MAEQQLGLLTASRFSKEDLVGDQFASLKKKAAKKTPGKKKAGKKKAKKLTKKQLARNARLIAIGEGAQKLKKSCPRRS